MFRKFESKLAEWKEQIDDSIEYVDKGRYHALDKYIKDKRIVLLGENSHFIGDYYSNKIDVIKYLHKHHGFNVVIFESGLLEASFINESFELEGIRQGLQESLLSIYQNEEIIPLFADPDLAGVKITGMDVQPTFKSVSNKIVHWIKNINYDAGFLIENAENLFFEIDDTLKNEPLKITKETKSKMKLALKKYAPILQLLDEIDEGGFEKSDLNKLSILKRGMLNRQQWLQVNLRGRFTSGSLRDLYMFENVQWLMKFNPNEKVIIWSHNYHVRKKRSLLLKLLRTQTVGDLLSRHYPKETYTIGLYAISGTCLTPLRNEFKISIQNKYHLELVLSEKDIFPILLPLNINKKVKRNHWTKRRWWLLESKFLGMAPIPMKPKRFYDALLFFNDVKPPTFFEEQNERFKY